MENNTGSIQLIGLEFYSRHGYYQEEHKLGNRFEVNLTVWLDIEAAAREDKLSSTVNYESLYQLVHQRMQHPAKLIETLAVDMAKSILDTFLPVYKVEICIDKHNPPFGGLCRKVRVSYCASRN